MTKLEDQACYISATPEDHKELLDFIGDLKIGNLVLP